MIKDITSIKQNVLDLIKGHSPLYTAMFLKNWKRYKLSVELFISSSHVGKDDTILDYGCGFPFIVYILNELGYKVTGYEPYAGPEELEIAGLLGLTGIYKTKLEEHLQFDHILMIDVIEHLAVIKPVLEGIYARAKPGGTLFISTPNVMRFDMWKRFIFRKTGHPTALKKYLVAEDSFRNHQREFTMQELITTVQHFKFKKIILETIRNTQPNYNELNAYHKLLNDQMSFNPSLKDKIQSAFVKMLPASVKYNNLFVQASRD